MLQDGVPVKFKVEETILEVALASPIKAGESTVLEMEFFIQTPAMIRRSGKNSEDNVAFSMSQWYPKLCQYDDEGWHANPYIGREFYGIWGDFDVTINTVSYTHLRAHETRHDLVCRLLLGLMAVSYTHLTLPTICSV